MPAEFHSLCPSEFVPILLVTGRDAIKAAAIAAEVSSGLTDYASGPSAAQQAMMKLNLSSESESGFQSPDGEFRHYFLFGFWQFSTDSYVYDTEIGRERAT